MRLHYRVRLMPDDAAARLRTQVDRPSLLYLVVPGLTSGAPFVGSVTSSGFNVRVRRRSANSLAPRAVGFFRRTATGTDIDATVGVGTAMSRALALVIGLIGVVAAPADVSSGVPAPVVITIAVVCAIAAVVIWLHESEDLGFPAREAQQLKTLLDATFESE